MPKKHKAGRTCKEKEATSYENMLFVSSNVGKRYKEKVIKKSVTVHLAKGSYSEILSQISAWNWQKLCTPPEGSIIPLVQEFQAPMPLNRGILRFMLGISGCLLPNQ